MKTETQIKAEAFDMLYQRLKYPEDMITRVEEKSVSPEFAILLMSSWADDYLDRAKAKAFDEMLENSDPKEHDRLQNVCDGLGLSTHKTNVAQNEGCWTLFSDKSPDCDKFLIKDPGEIWEGVFNLIGFGSKFIVRDVDSEESEDCIEVSGEYHYWMPTEQPNPEKDWVCFADLIPDDSDIFVMKYKNNSVKDSTFQMIPGTDTSGTSFPVARRANGKDTVFVDSTKWKKVN